jgi:thioredoxin reductase
MNPPTLPVVVIGAGPYGLAAAAHLRAAGIEHRVFGESLSFWRRHMPAGMLLRSAWEASHIDDPTGELSLDRFESLHGRLPRPIPLGDFIRYGTWFEERAVPEIDRRAVTSVERTSEGFRLVLDDGERLQSERVVVAGGIGPFASRPPLFDDLPPELASHSSDHVALDRFTGAEVFVVGGGQSALEIAALLHEAGAKVEVVARSSTIHFLRGAALRRRLGPLRPVFYPSTDVGPPGLSLIAGWPELFRRLPSRLADPIARRCIRPAGAGWLVPRVVGIPLHLGRTVIEATRDGERLRLRLDDETERIVDHVLLATGYRVDISRYSFLSPELVRVIARTDGYPRLGAGFESSVAGLHFLGAAAAASFGPVMRFVSGTRFAGPGLVRRLLSAG